jgi:ribosomal protein S12 methylthiotransferase
VILFEEMEFETLGVFQYSHEDDTAAHQLEDDISH